MYVYLYYFIKIYPFIYYIFTIYHLIEYYSFTRKICSLVNTAFYKAFIHVKESEEVEEIYEMILATEPDKTITIDDTKYVKYYAGDEETTEIKEEWFEQREGQFTNI